MMDEAKIVWHRHVNPLTGDMWDTPEWVGDPCGMVFIYHSGIDKLLWSYEIVENRLIDRGGYLIIRTDTFPCYVYARFQANCWRFWNWVKSAIGARLILTLHIWGLAYVPYGDIPSWEHIGGKRG